MPPAPIISPDPFWPFPVFPPDATSKAVGLAVGIFGLLLLPKLLIVLDAASAKRVGGFGGTLRAASSTFAELLLSSITAPIFLMFQTRSVSQVLMRRDGGWPANNRGDGSLTIADAWAASWWITATGSTGLGLAIVQAVVQSHGGKVTVASRKGRTEFVVSLPSAG